MILKTNKERQVVVSTKGQLAQLIRGTIEREGPNCDLNFIDISRITDLSHLFSRSFGLSKFNGDISKWDTENVTDMSNMFHSSQFTGDISKWNVGNATDLSYMFEDSEFSGDISKWNTGNVKHMSYMFWNSPLDKNPPKWVYYDTEEV